MPRSIPNATGPALAVITALATGAIAFAASDRSAVVFLLLPALAVVVALIARPDLGLLLLAATIPVQAAVMIADQVTAPKLIGLVVTGAWFLQKLLRRESWMPILANGTLWIGLILLALAAASLFWGDVTPKTQRQIILLAQLIVLCVLVSDLASSWTLIDRTVKLLVLGAFAAGVLIIAQFALGGVRRAGEGVTGGSVNSAARVMVIVLPFAFYLIRGAQRRGWRLLGTAFVFVATAAVVTTFSRTSFLFLPPVLGFYYFRTLKDRKRLPWLVVPIFAGLLALPFVPRERLAYRIATIAPYLSATVGQRESGEVSSGRGYHMRIALAIFADHPVLGSGYGSYGENFLEYQWNLPGAHKVYLSPRSSHGSHAGLLAELGAAGLLLWLGLFAAMARGLIRIWRGRLAAPYTNQGELVVAFAVVMTLNLAYGFAADLHQDKLFWLLVGLCIAVIRLAERPAPVVAIPSRQSPQASAQPLVIRSLRPSTSARGQHI